MLSKGILYNSDKVLPWEIEGSAFPFSHATNVFGLICSILATSDWVSSAFTLAAARLILNFSNTESLPFYWLFFTYFVTTQS